MTYEELLGEYKNNIPEIKKTTERMIIYYASRNNVCEANNIINKTISYVDGKIEDLQVKENCSDNKEDKKEAKKLIKEYKKLRNWLDEELEDLV